MAPLLPQQDRCPPSRKPPQPARVRLQQRRTAQQSPRFPIALLLLLVAPARASKKCLHGTPGGTQESPSCDCYGGWKTAGITDTWDFLAGVCAQYECQLGEDDICGLAIEGANCRVKGWNCYCGWSWAYKNFGHGWESDVGGSPNWQQGTSGNATSEIACMGLVYTFSFWSTEFVWILMQHVWEVCLLAAVVSLPFGRKRAICDHHWPSLWNCLRAYCFVGPSQCRGECVTNSRYSFDVFKDDIAWTIYFLDLCAWIYVFLGVTYLTVMFIWCALLWLFVMLCMILALFAAVCCVCAEGGGGGGGDCTGDCGTCDCACFGGDGDCCMLGAGGHAGGSADVDMFYWSGPFPHDPYWGYSNWSTLGYNNYGGTSPGGDDCSCCTGICKPIAWLIYIFPVLPENAWGGLFGYFVGTHPLTGQDSSYQGGSPFVDFFGMSWRRSRDLHGNDSWRRQVHDFLAGDDLRQNGRQQGQRLYQRTETGTFMEPRVEETADGQRVTAISPTVRAIHVDRPFNEDDRCVSSSMEDYTTNTCWICRTDNDEWDLWLSCRHLFCKDCSTEMLKRRMPCPLCRVATNTVLRGKSYDDIAAQMSARSTDNTERLLSRDNAR